MHSTLLTLTFQSLTVHLNTEAFKQRQSRQEGIDLPIEQNEFYWHYWNRILFDLEYQSRSKMTWFAHNVAVESIFSDEVRTVACWGLPTWITSFSFTCEQLGTDRGGIPERDRTFRSLSFSFHHSNTSFRKIGRNSSMDWAWLGWILIREAGTHWGQLTMCSDCTTLFDSHRALHRHDLRKQAS